MLERINLLLWEGCLLNTTQDTVSSQKQDARVLFIFVKIVGMCVWKYCVFYFFSFLSFLFLSFFFLFLLCFVLFEARSHYIA